MTRKIRSATGDRPFYASPLRGPVGQEAPADDNCLVELKGACSCTVAAMGGCNVHIHSVGTGRREQRNTRPRTLANLSPLG